jgi:hypothetical protein
MRDGPDEGKVTPVKRLPVDLAALAALFDEARNGPIRSFLDRQTGELESMPRDAEVEGVWDDVVGAPERWVEIVPLPLAERRQLRQRFAEEELADAHVHLRLRLFDALAGDRPLARFAAVLREQDALPAGPPTSPGPSPPPALVDRWLAYRARSLAPLARAWLSALGIEAGETAARGAS